METTAPATLHLERGASGCVLRTWGEYQGRVAMQGPGITARTQVFELSAEDARGNTVGTAATARGLSFKIHGGKAYALVEPGGTK